MNENTYPTVIRHGVFSQKRQLPITSRVAANTQRHIDKITRRSEASLRSAHQVVDIAQDLTNLDFKKERVLVKKRMNKYNTQLEEYKKLQKNRGSRSFFSQTQDYNDQYKHLPAVIRERQEAMAQIYNIDAIRSIRRKRKPILDNSMIREYSDLQKTQDRHIAEYRDAMNKMEALEQRTGITFSLHIPVRSLSAYTAPTSSVDSAYPDLINNMRTRIRTTQSQVFHIQRKYKDLSAKLFKNSSYADILIDKDSDCDTESKLELPSQSMLGGESNVEETTFNIYGDIGKQDALLLNAGPGTCSRQSSRLSSRCTKKAVRFDAEARAQTQPEIKRTTASVSKEDESRKMSLPMINRVAANSYNQYVQVKANPFDTGELAPQTRSRRLLETPKDDTMHIWLGFKDKEEMERALKNKKQPQTNRLDTSQSSSDHKQHLDYITSDKTGYNDTGHGETAVTSHHAVDGGLSDSSSSDDEEEEDPRFAIFNKRTLQGKKEKSDKKLLHTV